MLFVAGAACGRQCDGDGVVVGDGDEWQVLPKRPKDCQIVHHL